ncbi:hypothetical protein BR93DRAFT_966934 [Coniochaeta sp. PMI_546]|nr:hypothetical protein BR93DRAFT_966934 [Coniochaeta sp. PMI_546]
MKSTYALVVLGGVLSGVESKLVRWANDKRDADWRPAQATVAIDQLLHGMSPKPTQAPRAPGAAPDLSLDKRATSNTESNDNTCAYVSGIAASSLYCDADQACVYNSIYSAIGCCSHAILSATSNGTSQTASGGSTSRSCPVWTTCYDSTESASYTTDNGLTVYCGQSSYPTCIKHVYKDPVWTGYTLWGCARSARSDEVYYTPTVLTSTSSTSSSTTSSSSTSSTSTTSSGTTTSTADPSTSTSAAPVSGGSKSTPVGPIVGGVVGGVAGLGLIGLALFFILRRKKSGDAPPAAAGPTSPGQGPPPPPGPPGGYYDPNQPQMAQQQQQGQYGYGAAGFAPVDPRASIAKPPYAVQQTEYNPAFSPPGSPPPGSPAPTYNGAPGATPPPGAYGGQPVSPDSTGYGQQQQPYQATQYNQYQNQGPPQQAQPYGHQQPGAQPTHYAAELPTQRGDGEVRELAG